MYGHPPAYGHFLSRLRATETYDPVMTVADLSFLSDDLQNGARVSLPKRLRRCQDGCIRFLSGGRGVRLPLLIVEVAWCEFSVCSDQHARCGCC
jgi:hypothetical protein